MPNHITNEVIFRDLTTVQIADLLAATVNSDKRIDFGILVPKPLNIWWGSVSSEHEKAFKNTGLDWARENWGTKWNAYDCSPPEVDATSLRLQFDTAWSPPYPWLAAIFNKFEVTFEHNWFDEGDDRGWHAVFDAVKQAGTLGDGWKQVRSDDELQKHLHLIKWGTETPEEEEA